MVGLLLALPHKQKISMTRCLIIESLVPHVQLERLPVQSMVTMKHHPSNPHSLRFAAEKPLRNHGHHHSHVKPSYASDQSAVGKIAECTEQCFGRFSWRADLLVLSCGDFTTHMANWNMAHLVRWITHEKWWFSAMLVYRRVIHSWIQFGFFKHQTYGAFDW